MDFAKNILTSWLSAATNIIFLGFRVRTALGVVVGIGIGAVAKAFGPYLATYAAWIDLSRVTTFEYVIVGVVILHIPTILFYLRRRGSLLNENEEKAFEIIRRAKRNGVPDKQIEKMYLNLCERVLQNTELKQATKKEITDDLRGT